MNKLLLTAALGVAMASAPALAQTTPGGGEHHGGWAKDMTRAQAQQFADGMFQRLDANHDGVLTRAEADAAATQMGGGERAAHMVARLFGEAQSVTQAQAEAAALARFDAQDVNHDGVVSAAERQQARAARAAQKGQ
jgi:Ca2+-binding EF-hand superfamily protein